MAAGRLTRVTPRPVPASDLPGLLLLLAGTVLCAVAFSTLPWYSVDGGADSAGTSLQFSDLHADADQLVAPVAAAYFDRFAWGCVGVAVLLALAARAFALASLRVLAFLVAAAGFVLTCYALAQLFAAQRAAGGSAENVLHNAAAGLYASLAGYLLIGIGAVLGYSARSDTIDP